MNAATFSGCHRRRTGQRKCQGGDDGEFGQLTGGRNSDFDSQGFVLLACAADYTFHCARWNPVTLSTSTTLVTRSR